MEVTVIENLAGCSVASGVIRGVKAVGFEARNGRYYPPETLRAAVHLYEGVKVNIDHPPASDPNKPRSVADRFGVLKNSRFVEGSGIVADLHFNPEHRLAAQIAWDAEHSPGNVGLSHNAVVRPGKREGGVLHIAEVVSVRSVDLVADPATTKGVFEGTGANVAPEDWLHRLTGRRPAAAQESAGAEDSAASPWGSRLRQRV